MPHTKCMSKQSQTYTPSGSDTALVQGILGKLGQDGPMTIGNAMTGDAYPLPPEVAAVVRQVLARIAAGREVAVTDPNAELTPNEAAAMLNVSRMYVMKLIQDGTLPYRMVGNHHRIPFAELAAYKSQQQAKSRAAMDEIYALDRESGDAFSAPPDKRMHRPKGGRHA